MHLKSRWCLNPTREHGHNWYIFLWGVSLHWMLCMVEAWIWMEVQSLNTVLTVLIWTRSLIISTIRGFGDIWIKSLSVWNFETVIDGHINFMLASDEYIHRSLLLMLCSYFLLLSHDVIFFFLNWLFRGLLKTAQMTEYFSLKYFSQQQLGHHFLWPPCLGHPSFVWPFK